MLDLPSADVVSHLCKFHCAAIFVLAIEGQADKPPVLVVTATDIRRSMTVNCGRVYAATFKPGGRCRVGEMVRRG
jgi:hypothetical protein